MNQKIGIMQGRLLPRYLDRYQAFPRGYWEAEFHIAAKLGFAQIEFILDYNDAAANPLLLEAGLAQIEAVVAASGVGVHSICADYFMEAPFHSAHQTESEAILKRLIPAAGRLGVRDIVVPCVDQSTLKNVEDEDRLAESLGSCRELVEKHEVLLNLETDLNPHRFRALLDKIDLPYVRVNYDIGNSASLGYDPVEEFAAYGQFVSDLHIKDRKRGGFSVELGTGDAQMETVFELLKKHKFSGNVIMQAARADEYVDDLTLVQKQREYSQKLMERYL